VKVGGITYTVTESNTFEVSDISDSSKANIDVSLLSLPNVGSDYVLSLTGSLVVSLTGSLTNSGSVGSLI
jgi:hypothetical protein